MKPSVGQIVHFASSDPKETGNGAPFAPAMITRVWSDNCVNLTVFRDFDTPLLKTSVTRGEPDGANMRFWSPVE
ncbi:MAG: hypothetical protein Q8S09_13145 [Hyphomonas sp.]|nr:hypothetical protein [Hyphomonas sp.]